MKKLFSSIIIVMMIALAFTLVASAEEVYTKTNGLYNIDYTLKATDVADIEDCDGTQFGMVVIEVVEDEAFLLDEAKIRYIDQVGADDGKLTFDAFAPMDLKNNGTYKVYIGGGELEEATLIGTLSTETSAPTIAVESVTLDKETATVEVDGTVTLVATVNPDNATDKTVTWTASNANATVVDGVVTGVAAGEVVITATAGGKSDTCTVTVTAAGGSDEDDYILGDLNGDTNVDILDAKLLFNHSMLPDMFPVNYAGSMDFVEDGTLDILDAKRLFNHSMLPDMFPLQ